MLTTLFCILLFLLIIVGRKKGLKVFICFLINYLLIAIYIIIMAMGVDAILMSFIICIISSLITLFFLNGYNIKTKVSFFSVLIVLFIMFIFIYLICHFSNVEGFGEESLESIGGFSFDINYNMNHLIIGIIMVMTSGTIIDTSISISSALNEVVINNNMLTSKELYLSGMKIGRDILSTTINTLFYVFIGGFLAFFIWHQSENFMDIINYKSFSQEIIELLFCFIASILIIPTTSYLCSLKMVKK